jgi:hypothetical protein
MSPVPVTVPADAVLNTKNCRYDYSFFLLLVGVHHSTIRPTDLRLSASKSVVPQKVRTVGRGRRATRESRASTVAPSSESESFLCAVEEATTFHT